MAPRHQTLPPAQTSSAREALQSFYCQLCQKGYSRMNEYEAHLSSYDHSHRQRMKDMKAMVRDPNAAARARRQEAKNEGVISIKLGEAAGTGGAGTSAGTGAAGGGFKKGGFKKSGFKATLVPATPGDTILEENTGEEKAPGDGGAGAPEEGVVQKIKGTAAAHGELVESDTEDEGYEMYDPRFPTD